MPDPKAPDEQPEFRPSPRRREPDAYGQAALLLAESILLALVEAGLLSSEQAAGVVRTAAEIRAEVAEQIGESSDRMRESVGLLAGIERSIEAARGNDAGPGGRQEI